MTLSLIRTAVFGGNVSQHRYRLTRHWIRDSMVPQEPAEQSLRVLGFVMFNPSTADAEKDDPTIRRCMGFARSWGYDGLDVVNLFSYRTPRPMDVWDTWRAGIGVVGPLADRWILNAARYSKTLVAAWGRVPKWARIRRDEVVELLGPKNLHVLGWTQAGDPRHPLYVRKDAQLQDFVR